MWQRNRTGRKLTKKKSPKAIKIATGLLTTCTVFLVEFKELVQELGQLFS